METVLIFTSIAWVIAGLDLLVAFNKLDAAKSRPAL